MSQQLKIAIHDLIVIHLLEFESNTETLKIQRGDVYPDEQAESVTEYKILPSLQEDQPLYGEDQEELLQNTREALGYTGGVNWLVTSLLSNKNEATLEVRLDNDQQVKQVKFQLEDPDSREKVALDVYSGNLCVFTAFINGKGVAIRDNPTKIYHILAFQYITQKAEIDMIFRGILKLFQKE